jgi:hypothetical protein
MHCLAERTKKIKIMYFWTSFDSFVIFFINDWFLFFRIFFEEFFFGLLHQAVQAVSKNRPKYLMLDIPFNFFKFLGIKKPIKTTIIVNTICIIFHYMTFFKSHILGIKNDIQTTVLDNTICDLWGRFYGHCGHFRGRLEPRVDGNPTKSDSLWPALDSGSWTSVSFGGWKSHLERVGQPSNGIIYFFFWKRVVIMTFSGKSAPIIPIRVYFKNPIVFF